MIEIPLKWLFLLQNHKTWLGALPPGPLCDTHELHQLVQQGVKIRQFLGTKNNNFGSNPFPLS